MPARAIRCLPCIQDVPLDVCVEHFAQCQTYAPTFIAKVVDYLTSDTRHQELKPTTTCANDCPLRVMFARLHDYTIELGNIMPPMLGTWLHESLSSAKADGYVTEQCTCESPLPINAIASEPAPESGIELRFLDGAYHDIDCDRVLCTPSGIIHGVQTSGVIDALRIDAKRKRLRFYDYKFRSAYAKRWLKEDPDDDYVVQAIINTELFKQEHPAFRDYNASYHFAVVPWYVYHPMTIDPVPEVDHLKFLHPNGSDRNAIELLRECDEVLAEARRLRESDFPASKISDAISTRFAKRGRVMALDGRGGNMCSKWCEFKPVCWGTDDGLL